MRKKFFFIRFNTYKLGLNHWPKGHEFYKLVKGFIDIIIFYLVISNMCESSEEHFLLTWPRQGGSGMEWYGHNFTMIIIINLLL